MKSQTNSPLRYSDFDQVLSQKKTVVIRSESEYGRIVSGNVAVATMPSAMLLTTQNFSGLENVYLTPDIVNLADSKIVDSSQLISNAVEIDNHQADGNVSDGTTHFPVKTEANFFGVEFEIGSASVMQTASLPMLFQPESATQDTGSTVNDSSFSMSQVKFVTTAAAVIQSKFGLEHHDSVNFEGPHAKIFSINKTQLPPSQSNLNSTETGSGFFSSYLSSQRRTKAEIVKSTDDKEVADTLISATSTNLSAKYLPQIEYIIYSGEKDAFLTGNASNNTLIGSTGNDFLNGGGGDDQLLGGGGNDIFAFGSQDGFNHVLDFSLGDRLYFSNGDFMSTVSISHGESGQQVKFGDTIVELIGASGQTLNSDWIWLNN